jgi:hypothetical protein
VAVLLVTAGARTTLSTSILLLAAAYFLLRLAGKLTGAWLARRLSSPPSDSLGAAVLPPGVFGIAFTLNAAPLLDPVSGPIALSAVVVGSLLSQLTAAMWRGDEAQQ